MRIILLAVLLALTLTRPLAAQTPTEDRDYLTAFLEDNLSDAGRNVVITGFAGALSSRATVQKMTIADANGVWITLNGLTLDWSRSALLSGKVDITALTADEILVDRLPVAAPKALPDPEAPGFSLPQLPVSVQIGRLAATRIVLAPAVLGQEVIGGLESSLSLADGQGQAKLDLNRDDSGPEGHIVLDASYSNSTRELVLDLSATEGKGGLVSSILNLPGAPSVTLTAKGSGPTDAFTARILLGTDGAERLTGTLASRGDDAGGIGFSADLAGNFAPLLTPEYAAFFGDSVTLKAVGARDALGGLKLDSLDIASDALRLSGQLALAPNGQPIRFNLTGDLGLAGNAPVVLPLVGATKTAVNHAKIVLGFDAAKGEDWQLDAEVDGLNRPDLAIGRLTLTGSGRIAQDSAAADLRFTASDAVPADPAIAKALGTAITGRLTADFRAGEGVLHLPKLTVSGDGYTLIAAGDLGDLNSGLNLSGEVTAQLDDLSRLSLLAGQALKGAADIVVTGQGSPLGGTFDVSAILKGRALAVGQTEIDSLLAGETKIALSARRDETGIALRQLDLIAANLSASANGRLSSSDSDITAKLNFSDIASLGPKYRGALTLEANVKGPLSDLQIDVAGAGNNLAVGQPELDKVLRGANSVSAKLALKEGAFVLRQARIENPQFNATAQSDAGDIAVTARLANLALILPEFPGSASVTGTLTDQGSAYRVDLAGSGPGQIDTRVTGTVRKDFGVADLALRGTAQAGLANVFIQPRAVSGPVQFDLRLVGPVAVKSLSGRITLQGARFSDVEHGLALRDLAATANLSGESAAIEAKGALVSGGSITTKGKIGLGAGYPADLTIDMIRAKFRNPELFTAETNGQLVLRGPLLGGARLSGRVDVASAEIRIPSGSLSSLGAIPDIRHVSETQPVRETRRRAGLFGGTGAAGANARGGPSFALDIDVFAPGRLFIRGRGLDAELSGRLLLGGTMDNVVPSGQFSLIRGRLDILGKRLTLSEASLQLQGNFEPFVAIAASNLSDAVTSTVRIEGPAFDPAVTFTSSPELPQEEVLARLLFGRGLQNLSAFQAAQLANAVATLAGRGGEGIIGRLRKSFGLDDFDVTSDATGSTVLRAGKYISDKVYTEVEIGQNGKSEINLNLDIRPGLTIKGRVDGEGQTGLGVFLEKDY